MRKYAQLLFTLALGFLFFGTADVQEAHARSQYQKQMGKLYPALLKEKGSGEEGKKKFKCSVCHPGKTKKKRNDYGVALSKAIGKKNEKDTDKIKKAFEKVAKEKSTKDKAKTYGELIEEKKLPGTDKEAN